MDAMNIDGIYFNNFKEFMIYSHNNSPLPLRYNFITNFNNFINFFKKNRHLHCYNFDSILLVKQLYDFSGEDIAIKNVEEFYKSKNVEKIISYMQKNKNITIQELMQYKYVNKINILRVYSYFLYKKSILKINNDDINCLFIGFNEFYSSIKFILDDIPNIMGLTNIRLTNSKEYFKILYMQRKAIEIFLSYLSFSELDTEINNYMNYVKSNEYIHNALLNAYMGNKDKMKINVIVILLQCFFSGRFKNSYSNIGELSFK